MTGGAGFIGRTLCHELLKFKNEVVVVYSLSLQIHGPNAKPEEIFGDDFAKLSFFKGDVRDPELMAKALAGCNTVVHLAAETATAQSMYAMSDCVNVNVVGTAAILEILTQLHLRPRLIVASSLAIYGEGAYRSGKGTLFFPVNRKVSDLTAGRFEIYDEDGEPASLVPTPESAPSNGCSVYGISKFAQEQLVLTYCRANGLQGAALRFQNVFGPGQSLRNPYTGILSIFSSLLLNGQDVRIFEDGRESRDFIDVSDVVNSIMLSINKDLKVPVAVNIGTGVRTSVMHIAQTLKAIYKSKSNVEVTGEFRVGDVRHCTADVTLAEQILGFRSKMSFEAGIKAFAQWAQSQNPSPIDYVRTFDELRATGLLGKAETGDATGKGAA